MNEESLIDYNSESRPRLTGIENEKILLKLLVLYFSFKKFNKILNLIMRLYVNLIKLL